MEDQPAMGYQETDEEFDDDRESFGDFDDDMTSECPHCGREIFDDAEQCPHCGTWITGEVSAALKRSSNFILLGIVAAALALTVILLRG